LTFCLLIESYHFVSCKNYSFAYA